MHENGAGRPLREYFTHAPEIPPREPLEDATRYLCAAAHLDEDMSQQILKECLYEEQRAIVPSYGFDLRPVLAHCLKARRPRWLRDAVLTVTVAAGLVISWTATLAVLVTLFLLVVALGAIRLWGRAATIVNAVIVLAGGPVLLFLGMKLQDVASGLNAEAFNTGNFEAATEGGGHGKWFLGALGLFLFMLAVPVVHRWLMLRTLQSLGPNGTAPIPRTGSLAVQDRIEQVGAAQYGNVTLYSQENPFIGSGHVTGQRTRVWSMDIELDRTRPAKAEEPALPVDPVALRRAIERKLFSMRDGLPRHESVGLMVDDHVVAEGECVQGRRPFDPADPGPEYNGHPLIDRDVWRPYSKASPEAVDLLVRNPQADVRCYQRITLHINGSPVTDPVQGPLIPGSTEGVQVTAFLYLAVQGHMLYAQFVCNALPSIQKRFRIVDVLPSYGAGRLVVEALRRTGVSAVIDAIAGPFRLLGAAMEPGLGLWGSEGASRWRFFTFDYGARVSVREMAAEPSFSTFLQKLDVNKYTRLMERRILEALLDHLELDCNIDVSKYRAQAASIVSNSLIMNGGTVTGQIAFAPNGSVNQHAVHS
ncbi:hypothetical protein E1293_28700 [Actinomadura darangshiensis]|uniref:Uncharacterized protein n=1 Tax=Actinomadura darangshiensis TaxID=705336 RepID=A0A4V2YTT6_9ACTN|nr:hypothetical protein [Actinomadura darangshiensis]TDD75077.1 hypothetical protein E1293_28700 [Actinomadura darangshiensis]